MQNPANQCKIINQHAIPFQNQNNFICKKIKFRFFRVWMIPQKFLDQANLYTSENSLLDTSEVYGMPFQLWFDLTQHKSNQALFFDLKYNILFLQRLAQYNILDMIKFYIYPQSQQPNKLTLQTPRQSLKNSVSSKLFKNQFQKHEILSNYLQNPKYSP